jgi:hypothetical protein
MAPTTAAASLACSFRHDRRRWDGNLVKASLRLVRLLMRIYHRVNAKMSDIYFLILVVAHPIRYLLASVLTFVVLIDRVNDKRAVSTRITSDRAMSTNDTLDALRRSPMSDVASKDNSHLFFVFGASVSCPPKSSSSCSCATTRYVILVQGDLAKKKIYPILWFGHRTSFVVSHWCSLHSSV